MFQFRPSAVRNRVSAGRERTSFSRTSIDRSIVASALPSCFARCRAGRSRPGSCPGSTGNTKTEGWAVDQRLAIGERTPQFLDAAIGRSNSMRTVAML